MPISLWNDEGFVVACESDQNAAITMLALQTITGEPVSLPDDRLAHVPQDGFPIFQEADEKPISGESDVC